MRVLITYFGEDPRFFKLLQRCVASYHGTGCGFPLGLLTDQATADWLGNCDLRLTSDSIVVGEVERNRFDHLVREHNEGRNFDYKSTLILGMLSTHHPMGEQVCVVDCDNVFHQNPQYELDSVNRSEFAMPPDPGERELFPPRGFAPPGLDWRRPLVEHTSSLLVFPEPSRNSYEIQSLYEAAFTLSQEPDHLLLEQRTWSLVHHYCGFSKLLPRTMGWSRIWGPVDGATIVEHQHGQQKFEHL